MMTSDKIFYNDISKYLELTKPRVVLLIMLTATIGICLASNGIVDIEILIYANAGITLCSAAGAVINHIADKRIDILMRRTHHRPVATGTISTVNAIAFALVLSIVGSLILIYKVNALTAYLTLISLVGYSVIYTLLLKRTTPQNIVIGGLAGATPPLLGWTAVTNSVDGYGLLLVLIIFTWTPPHFWALAIARKDEYALAGIPMLPVTHGIKYTKMHIVLYTILLLVVSLLPFATGMSGFIYCSAAVILGVYFLYLSLLLLKDSDNNQLANKTFRFSISYLLLLFLFLLVDHYIMPYIAADYGYILLENI